MKLYVFRRPSLRNVAIRSPTNNTGNRNQFLASNNLIPGGGGGGAAAAASGYRRT